MLHDETRRTMLRFAAAGVAVAMTTKSAAAYQGNMEHALGSLREALGFLRDSTADKGGHRERAMSLIERAIAETQAGIDFAARKFGD
jgi:hypothetical protein